MDYPAQAGRKQAPRIEAYRLLTDLLLLNDRMFNYDELDASLPEVPVSKIRLAVKHGMNKGDIIEQKIGARLYFGTARRDYSQWVHWMQNPPPDAAPPPPEPVEAAPKLTFMVNDEGAVTLQRGAHSFELSANEAERFTMFAMNVANLWKQPGSQ